MQEVEINIPTSIIKELVIGNKTYRAAYDFHLYDDDLEKSRKELNETEEVRDTSLRNLKEMLSSDKDIRYRTDDAYLLRYLRYNKFDWKQAYQFMRNFYKLRKECPDLFVIPSNMERMMSRKIGNMLPYTDEDGTLLFIIKFGNCKLGEMIPLDLLHMCNFVSDIISMNPHAQVNGILGIWDFSGFTLSHVAYFLQPSTLRFCVKMLQELYPWRIKVIVLFNCNTIIHACFRGIRYLLKKKIADRVTPLRSDLTQLHKYVNPALLPKEYGGKLEDSECYSYMNQPILDNVQYLKYEHSFIE